MTDNRGVLPETRMSDSRFIGTGRRLNRHCSGAEQQRDN
jgi:hypothetical protein